MKNLWIFDFDGTLVNSEVAIRNCYLKVARKLIPERINFVKNITIGPTLEETTSLILNKEKIYLKDEFIQKFQIEYDEKIVLETPIYPNVNEVLIKLKNRGDSLCILTNKRSLPTKKLLKHYKWTNHFDWIACADMFPTQKNKSEVLRKQKINEGDYKNIYVVGDTIADGLAANSKNYRFIKANYGYGKNQDWKNINFFSEIDNILDILLI